MNLATYARRNVFRRKWRTILTVAAVTMSVLLFCGIRTVLLAFTAGAEGAEADRIGTRHKVSFTMQLPKHYIDEIRTVPGVKAATWANWFGGKDPNKRVPFFGAIAVDQESYLDVADDLKITPAELATWKQTRNGAVIGDKLAQVFGVKVGDKLRITSDIYPGDWDFTVVAIYQPMRKTVDRSSMLFRWDYLNDDPRGAFSKDQIGWVISRVTDPGRGAEVSRMIDAKFAGNDDQTLTMSERALALSFLGGFAALLGAFHWVSLVILLIMTLILANTIAMNARERTHEYGVLRAIGFPPGHIAGFIVGESLLVAAAGGLIGIGLVVLIINHGISPLLAQNGGAFSSMFTPGWVLGVGFAAAAGLGLIAGAIPAVLASRLKVTEALRRVD